MFPSMLSKLMLPFTTKHVCFFHLSLFIFKSLSRHNVFAMNVGNGCLCLGFGGLPPMVLTLDFYSCFKALTYRNGFTIFTKKSAYFPAITPTFSHPYSKNSMKQKDKREKRWEGKKPQPVLAQLLHSGRRTQSSRHLIKKLLICPSSVDQVFPTGNYWHYLIL